MKKIIGIFDKFFKTLGSCITPVVPVLVGAGMLKVALVLLGPSVFGILQETDNTFVVLTFVADAGYYFLPIYVAVASGEYFGTNKYIAALMGGALLSPKFVELINEGTSLTIFNLPIASMSYANEILPPIIIVGIESYVYKYIEKLINEKVRDIFVPLITIVIMVPIIYCAVGPLGIALGSLFTNLTLQLTKIGPIGVGIFAAILPFVVLFGLGGSDLAVMLSLNSIGPDPICFFSNVAYNCVLGSVAFACYLKDRQPDHLAASVATFVGGTSEPSLFGIAVKDRKALISTIIGCFVSGCIGGLLKVKTFAVASFGIFGIITTIGPESSILFAAIAIASGCLVGFVSYNLMSKYIKQTNA